MECISACCGATAGEVGGVDLGCRCGAEEGVERDYGPWIFNGTRSCPSMPLQASLLSSNRTSCQPKKRIKL